MTNSVSTFILARGGGVLPTPLQQTMGRGGRRIAGGSFLISHLRRRHPHPALSRASGTAIASFVGCTGASTRTIAGRRSEHSAGGRWSEEEDGCDKISRLLPYGQASSLVRTERRRTIMMHWGDHDLIVAPSSYLRRSFFSTVTTNNDRNSSTEASTTTAAYDVAIVGGGVVGATFAKRLCEQSPSLSIAVLDARPPRPLSDYSISPSPSSGGGGRDDGGILLPNPRAYALSPSSLYTLGLRDVVGVLRDMGRVADYTRMQVWESNGPGTLQFTSQDLANHPNTNVSSQNILGALIEDGPLVSALWDGLKEQYGNQVDFISPCTIQGIDVPQPTTDNTAGSSSTTGPVTLVYQQDGGGSHSNTVDEASGQRQKILRTNLLVAADGANSFVRRHLSIPTLSMGYGRQAVTTTVRLRDGHSMRGTAYQRFFPSGPLALLPLWGDGGGTEYANIVWSTTPDHAERLKSMSEEQFVEALNDALQVGPVSSPRLFPDDEDGGGGNMLHPILRNLAYGVDMTVRAVGEGMSMMKFFTDPFQPPPAIGSIVGGKRLSFDLNLSQARRYILPSHRVALVGDAAHTVHPLAGQGLNLGISDVECLSRLVCQAGQSGMDGGDAYVLDAYEKERQLAVSVMQGGIHALHTAFGIRPAGGGADGVMGAVLTPAIWARSLGLNAVNGLGPVRRRLAEVAAG